MDPRIVGAFNSNRGLLTYQQALDLGLSPGEIRRLRRTGEWVVVRRGVFTTAENWAALERYRGRARLTARAVTMTMSRGWVLSHNSAADELGLATLDPPVPLTHVTRPGWTNAWTEHEVSHHCAGFASDQVVQKNGLRMLDMARTAVDIARCYGFSHGLVACDSAMHHGVTRAQLASASEPMQHWPGVRAAHAAVDLADAGAATPHESLARELIMTAGLPRPRTQFPVETARGVFWLDMIVGNHAFEADGQVKLTSRANGGVADDPERALWQEKLRHRAIEDVGLVITRLVWADYYGQARTEAIRRILRDDSEAVRRFGPVTGPELVANAKRLRAGDHYPGAVASVRVVDPPDRGMDTEFQHRGGAVSPGSTQ